MPVGAQVAALGPADRRQKRDAVPAQPGPLLPRRELDVRARPAHRPGSSSSSRSNCALPCQSCQARSKESLTPRRRCSGESTRNSPPNDQNAWPPRLAAFSWSTQRRPACRRRSSSCGGDQPGQARSDDDHVWIHLPSLKNWRLSPARRRARSVSRTSDRASGPAVQSPRAAADATLCSGERDRSMDPRGRPNHLLKDATRSCLRTRYLPSRPAELSRRVRSAPPLAVWWVPSGVALACSRARRSGSSWLAAAIFICSALREPLARAGGDLLALLSLARAVGHSSARCSFAAGAGRRPAPCARSARFPASPSPAAFIGPTAGRRPSAGPQGSFQPVVAGSAEFNLLWWGSAVLGASLFAPVLLTWEWPSRYRPRGTESTCSRSR